LNQKKEGKREVFIMDAITGYIDAHPAVLIMIVIFVVILILYFIFKKFIKFVLVLLFILLAAGGYYYFKDPAKMPEKIKKSVDMMKSGINEVVDKSKSFYRDTKELYKKSKEVPGDINKLLKDSDEKAGK
jgi:predicted neutral ceramidase superfamily lipid hydrolase